MATMQFSAFLNCTFSDIFIAILLLFISSIVVNYFTSKGPMLWPILGIIPTVFYNMSNVYEWATDSVIRTKGTFHYRGMWFGKCHGVITINPSNIEYMLKTNFTNFPKGKYFHERFLDFLGNGIFNADYQIWKEQRRAANAEMHSTRFQEYSMQTVTDLVQSKLLVLMDKIAKEDMVIDLQEVLLRFTFDNICTAAFGVDPGCLDVSLPEVEFARAFEEATELTLFRFTVPPFVWKIMKALNVGSEKRLKLAIKTVHEFAETTVLNRRTELHKLSEKCDLLSRLMEVGSYSDKFLKDFCISFILAGRDTSSVALAWFFWLLNENPHVENRILEELSSIKSDASDACTVADLKRMEYLHAAISESLHLYPSVPIDFKEVQEDDTFPDGTKVKKGARVIYSIYSMARNEEIWGKDCREFKPERWLKDGIFVSENQFKYAVFNAGPRLCIGKKFAYMQMKMVVSSILRKYHVHVVKDQEVVPKLNTTLYLKNGLKVIVKIRAEIEV